MQKSGTEAIRTKIQPSKPKRATTNITNSHKTKRTYGQLSEQLFPKGGHSATETELKKGTKIRSNVTETLTPKQAIEINNKTIALERSVMNY